MKKYTMIIFCLAVSLTAFAQKPTTNSTNQESEVRKAEVDRSGMPEPRINRVVQGRKEKINGVIVKREADTIMIRDQNGMETTVMMTAATKVSERKSNPFRGARSYPMTSLLRGLEIEVEGQGDGAGNLMARKIRFTNDQYRVANSIDSRVTPVEGRVGDAENRLSQNEQNAQRLSGQIDEISSTTNTVRTEVKTAQETADKALTTATNVMTMTTNVMNATNERISMLDDYDARQTETVTFKVKSTVLSLEAKAALDDLAMKTKEEKGFIIQVAGFASADGNVDVNRRLSQRRADAVVRYLVENHNIPLRRIITPFGYGETNPLADNTTREGREQNRRVEVAILVSRGITAPAPLNSAGSSALSSTEEPRQRSVVKPDPPE